MQQELKILYKLDHPYICNYIESFEDDKHIYIVMEYCQGKDLMSRLEEKGHYTELEAARMIFKIIEGLNHIHNVHVVHRDLKPENIIIDDAGDPKIIDFGLSSDTLGGTKALKTYVGSKVYMAPEILENTGHSSTCDMWSIGIILYLLLSGQFPFSLRNLEHEISHSPVCFPPHKWENISLVCKHFILKLLDKCRDRRI